MSAAAGSAGDSQPWPSFRFVRNLDLGLGKQARGIAIAVLVNYVVGTRCKCFPRRRVDCSARQLHYITYFEFIETHQRVTSFSVITARQRRHGPQLQQ